MTMLLGFASPHATPILWSLSTVSLIWPAHFSRVELTHALRCYLGLYWYLILEESTLTLFLGIIDCIELLGVYFLERRRFGLREPTLIWK